MLQAGGFPVELPASSLSETFMKPTTMLYRNLLAMEAEELSACHPVDGAVLMGGCDKTTPGPAHGRDQRRPPGHLPARPGRCCAATGTGKALGTGTDAWKYWDERRAGKIDDADWVESRTASRARHGTCMTMGTASTMTAIAETLGLTLPGASSIPAVHSGHTRMAAKTGRRIVEMVWEDLTPRES